MIDIWNDKELYQTTSSVIKIEAESYNFEATRTNNNRAGRWETNLDGNIKRTRQGAPYLDKRFDFPLVVGKKWDTVTYDSSSDGGTYKDERKVEVLAFEKVKTPAGEFDAFKISRSGWWTGVTFTGSGRNEQLLWYAPAVKYVVKYETKNIFQNGSINWQDRQELVSYCITDVCKAKAQVGGAAEMKFATLSVSEITALITGKKISFNSPQFGRCNVSYTNDGKVAWQCAGNTGSGVYRIGRFTPQGTADEKSAIRLCTTGITPIVPSDCTVLYKREDGTFWGWNKVMQLAVADM